MPLSNERIKAVQMANELRAGKIAWKEFVDEFNNSSDPLIGELYDLLEHQPKRGGILGCSEKVWDTIQGQINAVILELEK